MALTAHRAAPGAEPRAAQAHPLRARFNVHGHVHDGTEATERHINLTVKQTGYVPLRLSELVVRHPLKGGVDRDRSGDDGPGGGRVHVPASVATAGGVQAAGRPPGGPARNRHSCVDWFATREQGRPHAAGDVALSQSSDAPTRGGRPNAITLARGPVLPRR